ncbi:hypothetical protein ES703_112602 [subsurface metagenome]
MLGTSPLKLALKALGEVRVSRVVSWSRVPDVIPHSKETSAVDAIPKETRLPFKVAELLVMLVAFSVATEGREATLATAS